MKLSGDSSLHFVPLRMTDAYVFEGEVVGNKDYPTKEHCKYLYYSKE